MRAKVILNEIRRTTNPIVAMGVGSSFVLKGWYMLKERYPNIINENLSLLSNVSDKMEKTLTSEREKINLKNAVDVIEFYTNSQLSDFYYLELGTYDDYGYLSKEMKNITNYVFNELYDEDSGNDSTNVRVLYDEDVDNGNRLTMGTRMSYSLNLNMGRWYISCVNRLTQSGIFLKYR